MCKHHKIPQFAGYLDILDFGLYPSHTSHLLICYNESYESQFAMVGHMTHISYVEPINFSDTLFNEYTAEKNKATLYLPDIWIFWIYKES